MSIPNTPDPTSADEDDLLPRFITGRGNLAFRTYIRLASSRGWPRPSVRFALQALYSRLGAVMRDGGTVDELSRFLRVLQETEGEASGGPDDLQARVAALGEFVTDVINQEGGPNSENVLQDPSALTLIQHLANAESNALDEESLAALVPQKALFSQAIYSLFASGLITWLDADGKPSYVLSRKGQFRLETIGRPHPLEKLTLPDSEIQLFTPILPVFDMMSLPFAGAIMASREKTDRVDGDSISPFGVDVQPKIRETALVNWLKLDEQYLDSLSSLDRDIGGIIMPRATPVPTVDTTSMNIGIGNTFVGFHLLVSNAALKELRFPRRQSRIPPIFPSSVEEMKSLVAWRDFTEWLRQNDMVVRIFADESTRPLLETLLNCIHPTEGEVTFEDLESNSGRLKKLGPKKDGVLNLAVSTGPLLAVAQSADLSVLTTSWDMLGVARETIDYQTITKKIVRQYVHVAVSKAKFEKSVQDLDPELPDFEDYAYRLAGFVEEVYRLIHKSPDRFAEYCVDQWHSLREAFPNRVEFEFDLAISSVRFAIDASYRWVGQDLSEQAGRSGWPQTTEDLRDCAFWGKSNGLESRWLEFQARRQDLKRRIDGLTSEAVDLIGARNTQDVQALRQRVADLRGMGGLRRAEQGLLHAIRLLREREAARGT